MDQQASARTSIDRPVSIAKQRSMRQVVARPGLLIALALHAFAPAASAEVYQWVDASGKSHYSDSSPPASVGASVLPIDNQTPDQIVKLRVDEKGGRDLAWVDNRLSGPVQVELSFSGVNNIFANPPLPRRAVLPAGGSMLLSSLDLDGPDADGKFGLSLVAAPGDPDATPQDVVYLLPVQTTDWSIAQGWGSPFSHHDPENFYAVDFSVKEGTPILAARAGVVMQVESKFTSAGLSRERFGARANVVRILHDDGSMAVYAHLRPSGVWVRQGQRVHAGETIGLSGNTGFTSGPHLHFAIEVNRGMREESIPMRIRAPDGTLLHIPQG